MISEDLSFRMKNLVKGVLAKAEDFSRHMPFKCLYPDCSSMPIDCHSQQCNGVLSVIADGSRMVVVSNKDAKGRISRMLEGASETRGFRLVNINRATIFKGFCRDHDAALFSAVEKRPLVADDDEQVLAFHRRAIAFEVRGCLELLVSCKVAKFLFEQGKCFLKSSDNEIWLAEERLKSIVHFDWNPLWVEAPNDRLCHAWRILPKKLPVSLSSVITPYFDDEIYNYYRSELVSLGVDIIPRLGFTLTIVPRDNQTHVIMVWNRIFDQVLKPYSNRLMSLDLSDVEEFLNESVFCLSEDWCMNPTAWNSVPQSVKHDLTQNISRGDFGYCTKNIPHIITI